MSKAEEASQEEYSADDGSINDDAAKPRFSGADLAAGGSLDKVRTILFGAQAREYEKRFNRLEERLVKETSDLKDEVRQRFDSLESFIKREVESLSDRLKSEHNDRSDSVQELSHGLAEMARSFDKKIGQLDEQFTKKHREISEQLLDQSKNLGDEIRRRHEEVSVALEREAQELRFDKTDRSALAAMFTELAMRINNELIIPGSEEPGDD